MFRTIKESLDVIGANRTDVENWLRHQDLQTAYEPTVAGRTRPFSRENVEELAVTAAFVRVGFRPSEAIAIAASSRRQKKGGHIFEWAIMPQGQISGIMTDELKPEHLEKATAGEIAAAHVVRVGEIYRRVAKLFEEETAK